MSNIGPEASEEKSFENLNIKKVKCQCMSIILTTLVDLEILSPMIYAKIQPQGILGSGGRFLKVFTIYRHIGHLGQWTATSLAIFHSPAPVRL